MAYSLKTFGYGTGQSPISNNFLENTLPGYTPAISSAMETTQNLLSGLPSISQTRQANAYFGVGSGMPSSDFVRNRGYDLYRQAGDQYRQTGIEDLLKLIPTVSGPELSNQGQQFQNRQFYSQLGQTGKEFSQDLDLRKFLANLQAIGLGQNIINSNRQQIPSLG